MMSHRINACVLCEWEMGSQTRLRIRGHYTNDENGKGIAMKTNREKSMEQVQAPKVVGHQVLGTFLDQNKNHESHSRSHFPCLMSATRRLLYRAVHTVSSSQSTFITVVTALIPPYKKDVH